MPILICLLAMAYQDPIEPVYSSVTVTTTMGRSAKTEETAPLTTVKGGEDLKQRALTTIGNALEGSPGILVQQTTTAQVSPFLRGLTGYQVLNLVDGIRFNNSTFRSGPNQYLAFMEPAQARTVEAVMGPAGSLYGSDAMGGTIQVLTLEPRFSDTTKRLWTTDGMVFAGSADMSAGGNFRIGAGTARLAWLGGAALRRHNDLRGGGGVDSRHALRRLFGLDNMTIGGLTGSSMENTSFTQGGAHTKAVARPTPRQSMTGWYQYSEQHGVNGYKDLWGGLGRMVSQFTPQRLHFAYGRWEILERLGLDRIAATFSVNSQTDGGRRQALRTSNTLTEDFNRVDAIGYSGQAAKAWSGRGALVFGGEFYDERVGSARLDNGRPVRPLYPDGSRYKTTGAFAQAEDAWFAGRLRGLGGVRWTRVAFAMPGWNQRFRDVTMNASLAWRIVPGFEVYGLGGRGFRAPNLNDLGALGLNDLGYEIPAAEAGQALMGASAGENALPSGRTVSALKAESLWNSEVGVRVNTRRFYTQAHGFNTELLDPIVRRTLLYPIESPPAALAGLPVSVIAPTAAQREAGVVTVATALDSRAVKAFVNDGQSRYYGIESLLRWEPVRRWKLEMNYSIINGRDLYPNRPVRRLPPQTGSVALRWTPERRRIWLEVRADGAGRQDRLSGGDLDDERIGAARSRNDIASFFNGDRIAPYVVNGRFQPTGETLSQIQDRVLPRPIAATDTLRVPLYRGTAGWISAGVRGGIPIGERWSVVAALENVADANYRVHGSGTDGAGINVWCGLRWQF